jgi:hypothetical protein
MHSRIDVLSPPFRHVIGSGSCALNQAHSGSGLAQDRRMVMRDCTFLLPGDAPHGKLQDENGGQEKTVA